MNLNGQPEKVEIEGIQFFIYPFNAMEALKLKTTFLKKVAPAFGQLVGDAGLQGAVKKFEDIELNGKALSGALEKLFIELEEDEFANLIKRFIKNTTCMYKVENKEMAGDLKDENVFNTIFCRKLTLLYRLIFEIIKINYPDFFRLMGGIGNRIKTVF